MPYSDNGLDPAFMLPDTRGELILGEAGGCERSFALLIAALRTCVRVGLIPQAKHGGNGVCAFAAAGSKFEGNGFEKVHMGQTQVAVETAGSSEGGREILAGRAGETEPFPRGEPMVDTRLCCENRFGGLGTIVTLGDDFKNPA